MTTTVQPWSEGMSFNALAVWLDYSREKIEN
jgi:hypothetical protein